MTARIVVGVDGSDHSRRALAYAVEEVARRDATIDAVMAYPSVDYYPGTGFGATPPPPSDQLEAGALETLRQVLGSVPKGVTVDPIVVPGSSARALLDTARGADLLVVGSRGRGGFTGLLLGSTSHQVISHAPCPVVVVPASGAEDRASTAA